MTIIKALRLQRGLDPHRLADAAGITLEAYRDLEYIDDEWDLAPSIHQIALIAHELGVKPSALYGGTSDRRMSLDALALLISERLQQANRPLSDFEEEVGWDLAEALSNPSRFLNFNARGLRDVCTPIDINWFEVLDGIML